MKIEMVRDLLGLAQLICALRVVGRMLDTAGGMRVQATTHVEQCEVGSLSVLVPVLNEVQRLAPCLEGLLVSGPEVGEILVIDGGSSDGTQDLVQCYQRQDSRIRLLDASPIPPGWNGKAWGLHYGLQQVNPACSWLLTLDADVRPAPWLTSSLLAHVRKTRLVACSIAMQQEIAGLGQGLLHPAFLTTLVYRFGIPGHATSRVSAVQANGQCFLLQRKALEACGGFAGVRASLCEDVTLARALAAAGYRVGFYEAQGLGRVRMYEHWHETWQNWSRSLPMHDRFSGWQTAFNWLELVLVQAAPLPLVLVLALTGRRPRWLLLLNGGYVVLRLGVLCGTARAYCQRPWSYWLSPLCDLPVVLKLVSSALRKKHIWRGRLILRGGCL